MKQTLLIFLVLSLSISLISAASSFTFKQYGDIDLKLPVFDENNAPATSAISCNVTIRTPTQLYLVNNKQTSWGAGGIYNISIPGNLITELGEYPASYSCCSSTYCGFTSFTFRVTTTGKDAGNTLPLFLLGGWAVVFAFALWRRNEYLGLFSGMLLIVAGIYMMIYGLGLFADMYTQIIAYISIGWGLISCFYSVYEMYDGGEEEE